MLYLALVFAVTACSAQQQPAPQSTASGDASHTTAHGSHGTDPRPVLYDSLGSHSYQITTTSPDAQRWFDQGLRFVLFGLAASLRAQGKTAEAAQVEELFKKSWAQSDVTLTASRF